ncbi:MAG: hypothetical protein KC422_05350 [Trueperaceae bacterium]|nr:hypothetical protein [Trueperaceae bacterium]
MKKSLSISILLVALVALLAACGQTIKPTAETEAFIQDTMTEAQEQSRGNAIIDELELANGSIVRFIDESASFEGGSIGMLELIGENAEPVLAKIEEKTATALEIYKFLAPDKPAPQKLIEHHKSLAASTNLIPVEARTLDLAESSLATQDGGVLWSWCSNQSTFKNTYLSSLHYPNNFKHFGFGGGLWGTNYGVTGSAKLRALSICNHPNATSNTQVRIEKKLNYAGTTLWVLIQGTTYTMVPHRGMWYASQDPNFYLPSQYRVKAAGGYYSIAGSWGQK